MKLTMGLAAATALVGLGRARNGLGLSTMNTAELM